MLRSIFSIFFLLCYFLAVSQVSVFDDKRNSEASYWSIFRGGKLVGTTNKSGQNHNLDAIDGNDIIYFIKKDEVAIVRWSPNTNEIRISPFSVSEMSKFLDTSIDLPFVPDTYERKIFAPAVFDMNASLAQFDLGKLYDLENSDPEKKYKNHVVNELSQDMNNSFITTDKEKEISQKYIDAILNNFVLELYSFEFIIETEDETSDIINIIFLKEKPDFDKSYNLDKYALKKFWFSGKDADEDVKYRFTTTMNDDSFLQEAKYVLIFNRGSNDWEGRIKILVNGKLILDEKIKEDIEDFGKAKGDFWIREFRAIQRDLD